MFFCFNVTELSASTLKKMSQPKPQPYTFKLQYIDVVTLQFETIQIHLLERVNLARVAHIMRLRQAATVEWSPLRGLICQRRMIMLNYIGGDCFLVAQKSRSKTADIPAKPIYHTVVSLGFCSSNVFGHVNDSSKFHLIHTYSQS